jgi:hypothetical protein
MNGGATPTVPTAVGPGTQATTTAPSSSAFSGPCTAALPGVICPNTMADIEAYFASCQTEPGPRPSEFPPDAIFAEALHQRAEFVLVQCLRQTDRPKFREGGARKDLDPTLR